jgi:hypothetical protein
MRFGSVSDSLQKFKGSNRYRKFKQSRSKAKLWREKKNAGFLFVKQQCTNDECRSSVTRTLASSWLSDRCKVRVWLPGGSIRSLTRPYKQNFVEGRVPKGMLWIKIRSNQHILAGPFQQNVKLNYTFSQKISIYCKKIIQYTMLRKIKNET